jgi:hypothetical protein
VLARARANLSLFIFEFVMARACAYAHIVDSLFSFHTHLLDQLSKNKRNSKELTLIQYVCEKEKDRLSATNILWITPPNISSLFIIYFL